MRAMQFISKPFVLALLVGVAMSMPAIAQAGTTTDTMTVQSNVFPAGAAAPDGLSGTATVKAGSSITLTAPQYLYDSSTSSEYEFMFWNVHAGPTGTATVTFTAPTDGAAFTAAAWYIPIGGSGCTTVCPPPSLTTWAFSLTADNVLPQTPIASVSPSSAWTSPSKSVSTIAPVTVTALNYIGAHSKYSGTVFNSWLGFGAGTTISGANLSITAGASPYGIAFYTQYSVPPRPPCIGYPYCI